MIEFVTGFIIGSGWWLLAPLILFSILTEHWRAPACQFFFTLWAVICAVVLFNVSWTVIGYSALAYIPIGFLWSFWRWKKRCDKEVRELETTENPGNWSVNVALDRVSFRNNIGKITSWVFCWPFSMVGCCLEDLIDAVQSGIRKIGKITYEKWSADAEERIEKMRKEES